MTPYRIHFMPIENFQIIGNLGDVETINVPGVDRKLTVVEGKGVAK